MTLPPTLMDAMHGLLHPQRVDSTPRRQNGIAVFKPWRYDLRLGIVAAMVSLPLSLGVAVTSGTLSVYRIVAAIGAGFLLPYLGRPYIVIGKPSATLARAAYAGLLLFFLVFARTWLSVAPTAVLASVLVLIAFKFCRSNVREGVPRVSPDELAVWATSIIVALISDVLIGVLAGVALRLVLNVWYTALVERLFAVSIDKRPSWLGRFVRMFRSPVVKRELHEGVYKLYFDRPVTCFNLAHVVRELDHIPAEAEMACLHLSSNVTLIDQPSSSALSYYLEEHNSRPEGSCRLELNAREARHALSKRRRGMRVNVPRAARNGKHVEESVVPPTEVPTERDLPYHVSGPRYNSPRLPVG